MTQAPRQLPTDVHLVLTGFMGTGKSTVGRVLAARLGRTLLDTDALIEAEHGPIPTIFAEQGEEGFRAIERDVAAEVAERTPGAVVSTGGRMLLDPANAAALMRTSVVVCLTASIDELVRRLAAPGAAARPLLAGGDPAERIATLLAERAEGYGAFPAVATDGRTPEAIADEVLAVAVHTLA